MNDTTPTSEMSLSALRPELFRLAPRLRETGEVLRLTHHGVVIAVLGPPSLMRAEDATSMSDASGQATKVETHDESVVIRIRRDERQLPALLKLFLGSYLRIASPDEFPDGTLVVAAEIHDQLDWFVEEATS